MRLFGEFTNTNAFFQGLQRQQKQSVLASLRNEKDFYDICAEWENVQAIESELGIFGSWFHFCSSHHEMTESLKMLAAFFRK